MLVSDTSPAGQAEPVDSLNAVDLDGPRIAIAGQPEIRGVDYIEMVVTFNGGTIIEAITGDTDLVIAGENVTRGAASAWEDADVPVVTAGRFARSF